MNGLTDDIQWWRKEDKDVRYQRDNGFSAYGRGVASGARRAAADCSTAPARSGVDVVGGGAMQDNNDVRLTDEERRTIREGYLRIAREKRPDLLWTWHEPEEVEQCPKTAA